MLVCIGMDCVVAALLAKTHLSVIARRTKSDAAIQVFETGLTGDILSPSLRAHCVRPKSFPTTLCVVAALLAKTHLSVIARRTKSDAAIHLEDERMD